MSWSSAVNISIVNVTWEHNYSAMITQVTFNEILSRVMFFKYRWVIKLYITASTKTYNTRNIITTKQT